MYTGTLLLFALLLLALATVNRFIGGRWTYPPAIFSAVWAATLFGLVIAGDFFYPISLPVLVVFLLGPVCFSAAGLLTLGYMQHLRSPDQDSPGARSQGMGWILDGAILFLILTVPFFYRRLTDLAGNPGISNFWVALRAAIAYGAEGQSAALGGFSRILAVATFLCFIATAELDKTFASKRRAAILIPLTATMHTLTMARLGAAITIFGCVGVFVFKSQRLRLRSVLIVGLSSISVFAPAAILLGKGGSQDAGIAENASGVFQSIALYSLGNAVALDQAVLNGQRRPLETPDFIRIPARSLGLVEQPPAQELYEPYVYTPNPTNNYTIYFQYFTAYGFLGVALGMLMTGAACTVIYAAAVRGSRVAIALFGLVFGQILVSIANEGFYRGLSYNIQAIAVIVVLYRAAAILDTFSSQPRTAPFDSTDGVPCAD